MRVMHGWRTGVGVVAVGTLVAAAMWPSAVEVETTRVVRGPLTVTIDEEAETRIRDRYVVSSPFAARLLRIELDPGDRVEKGRTVLARLQPEPVSLLDARSAAEARAALDAAQATLGRARAEARRADHTHGLADAELRRARELFDAGLTTRQVLDQREADARAAEDAAAAAQFTVATAEADVERARARLAPATGAVRGRVIELHAPISGVLLRRMQESEAVVPQGAPLMELGDPTRLELVADLLSADAVRVRAGAKVVVDQWGGDRPLTARVRRVEPSAFTKISALGVEEQRVNVVMDVGDEHDAWAAMGDGFRVDVRIVTWEAAAVLKVPTAALFRHAGGWAVYVVSGGRARTTAVEVGHRNEREAEILGGLQDGAEVAVHPDDRVADGVRVNVRAAS